MTSGARPLILVVDDETEIRALLTDILADLGYETIAFSDGEAAIAALEKEARPVRLAIVDLVLPGKGGLETLRALRAARPGLPGIISTGYEGSFSSSGRSLQETARAERFQILGKPYKIDELAAAIERALG